MDNILDFTNKKNHAILENANDLIKDLDQALTKAVN